MVEVQLTGYQFCHYFFMCLSAKKKVLLTHQQHNQRHKCFTDTLICSLLFVYVFVIGICISVTVWGYSTKVQVPCIVLQLILIHKSTCIVILLVFIAVLSMFPDHKGWTGSMASVLVSRKECLNQEFGCLTMTTNLTYRT